MLQGFMSVRILLAVVIPELGQTSSGTSNELRTKLSFINEGKRDQVWEVTELSWMRKVGARGIKVGRVQV